MSGDSDPSIQPNPRPQSSLEAESSLLCSPIICSLLSSCFLLYPIPVSAPQSAIAMDEIAPEYDVVVLGTGTTRPRMLEGQREQGHDMKGNKLTNNTQVSRNVCSLGTLLSE